MAVGFKEFLKDSGFSEDQSTVAAGHYLQGCVNMFDVTILAVTGGDEHCQIEDLIKEAKYLNGRVEKIAAEMAEH
jgi:predicted RNA-binding protein